MITRDNIDSILDSGRLIRVHPANKLHPGYLVRRNGATKLWKRDPSRIRIPCKCGLRGTFAITESDFNPHDGTLNFARFRVRPE